MEITPFSVCRANSVVGAPRGRSVCVNPASSLLQLETRLTAEAEAVDAFSQDCNSIKGCAFPPFALIGRCPKTFFESYKFNSRQWWIHVPVAQCSPEPVRIVPIYRDGNDIMKLLFARKMSAVFQKSHIHKEIYCFQSLTAFIRDFQRAKDKKKHQ